MRETVTLFRPEQRGWEMIPPQPILRGPGVPHLEREPVHLRNTFNIEEELYETLMGHIEDYERLTPEVVEWEEAVRAEDTLLLVAHGIVGRAAKDAAERLQREGWPVGIFVRSQCGRFRVRLYGRSSRPIRASYLSGGIGLRTVACNGESRIVRL